MEDGELLEALGRFEGTFRRSLAFLASIVRAPSTLAFRIDPQLDAVIAATPPDRILLSGSQAGLWPLPLITLAASGRKVAAVVRKQDPLFSSALRSFGVDIVDLTPTNSRDRPLVRLRELQLGGTYVHILLDAPGNSRRTTPFLGYEVSCSRLSDVLARRHDLAILGLVGTVDASGTAVTSPMHGLQGSRTDLPASLACVADLIERDPTECLWTPSSVILTDPRAVAAGFERIGTILEWWDASGPDAREERVRHTRPPP